MILFILTDVFNEDIVLWIIYNQLITKPLNIKLKIGYIICVNHIRIVETSLTDMKIEQCVG